MSKDLSKSLEKGELKDGEYYVKLIGDKVYILAREDNHWYEFGWKNTEEENKKLKEENEKLKQKVTSRNKRLQKYKKLKGELATLASNRNILIKRLKEENAKLKELLKEWVKFYPIVLYEYEDTLKTKDIIELREKTVEVLNEKMLSNRL